MLLYSSKDFIECLYEILHTYALPNNFLDKCSYDICNFSCFKNKHLLLLLLFRHIIFAPSSHNKYAGESFPGIYDAMFDIENRADPHLAWAEVKKHISIATFTIQAAAGTLTDGL